MSDPYELAVIIPTYREGENIGSILRAVHDVLAGAGIRGEILVVDDSSPDDTIPGVRALQPVFPELRLVVRTSDPGLSQSVVEGFGQARAPVVLVMDADFSHPPALIPRFLGEIRGGADIVIGSRYMPGGGIEDWPLGRRIISSGATFLGRVLFPEITDPVSGFFALKKDVVAGAPLQPRGYKILMEVLGKGSWRKAAEIPFTFHDRKAGSSKLRPGTILDYLRQVVDISRFAISRRQGAAWEEIEKIGRFAIVGCSGILVNMGLLWILTQFGGLYYLVSGAIAIEVSILNNFLWNDRWTFGKDPAHRTRPFASRILLFHAISIGGAVINWLVLLALTEYAGIYYLVSNMAGILAGFIWNFLLNRHVTWKKG
ncbi:MAG TPA: GtrA family protein [Methanomicrobiales archaeon]|nr:GtrA family protein [Methanomicrobiales archaeon]